MKMQLVKLEGLDQWAVVNSTMGTMLPYVFYDHLQALLFLAFVEKSGIQYDSKAKDFYAREIMRWLDEVAPHYYRPGGYFANGVRSFAYTGPRVLPDTWALALVDREDWDDDAMQKAPEYLESELITDLELSRKGVVEYLIQQWAAWEPKKAGASQ
jgi:hypothetical protein